MVPASAMEPVINALLLVRRQSSRATSGVRRGVSRTVQRFECAEHLLFGKQAPFRNGVCPNSAPNAKLNEPSNTGLPVRLVTSARTMVSWAVSLIVWRERQYRAPATATAMSRAAATNHFQRPDTGSSGMLTCRPRFSFSSSARISAAL